MTENLFLEKGIFLSVEISSDFRKQKNMIYELYIRVTSFALCYIYQNPGITLHERKSLFSPDAFCCFAQTNILLHLNGSGLVLFLDIIHAWFSTPCWKWTDCKDDRPMVCEITKPQLCACGVRGEIPPTQSAMLHFGPWGWCFLLTSLTYFLSIKWIMQFFILTLSI